MVGLAPAAEAEASLCSVRLTLPSQSRAGVEELDTIRTRK